MARFTYDLFALEFLNPDGRKLCDTVYELHEPKEQVDVEIVLFPPLEFKALKDAYSREQEYYPAETWLMEKFPGARILYLLYAGEYMEKMTDLYRLGKRLVQEMTSFAKIGQHECPVVFVCHGSGAFLAKQILVTASQNLEWNKETQNLLSNLRAFYFYKTPPARVDFARMKPLASEGSYMSYQEFSTQFRRLNHDFEREVYNNKWLCYNVDETHYKLHGRDLPEASARLILFDDYPVDHGGTRTPQKNKYSWPPFLGACVE